MSLEKNICSILSHVSNCQLELNPQSQMGCPHIGAVLADAVLQAGLNYTHVVRPRVVSLMHHFPSGCTTSGLIDLIGQHGAANLLNWRHPEKPLRLRGLANFFYVETVETTNDLRLWLQRAQNRDRLHLLRGIGPKTVDYIQSLVGLPAIAVDRHIRSFAELAGLGRMHYAQVKTVMELAADRLKCGRLELDVAIWRFMSSGQRSFSHD